MEPTMKRKKKKIFVIVLAVLLLLIVGAAAVVRSSEANLEQLESAEIRNIDLGAVSDGTYEGKCKVFPVEAIVRVTVKDHVITAVDLVKHRNGKGQAAEKIPSVVVKAQSLQVDTVTGATYSSKAILKAIEDALTQ
jgi:uncharacterized protein with FMN-binding domain